MIEDGSMENAPALLSRSPPDLERRKVWLRSFFADPINVQQARLAVARNGPYIDLSRCSNRQVADLMAWELHRGALRLEAVLLSRAGVGQTAPVEPVEEESAPPPRYEPPPPPERGPGDQFDQDLQAQTLRAAAVTGVPFCEECEKRRQAGASGTPVAA